MQPSPALNYYQQFRFEDYKRGIMRIDEDLDDETVSSWLSEIRNIDKIVPEGQHILVSISSPGGSVYASFALFDALTALKSKRHVICDVQGYAASAAAMIVLQAGSYRTAGPTARILVHEARKWGGYGIETVSNMRDEVKEMDAIEESVVDIMARRCGRTHEDIKKMMERKEHWMSASEAVDLGLIDEITNKYSLQ